MTEYKAQCVVDSGNTLGECPLWSPSEACLYWIDVATPGIWRYAPSSGRIDKWALPKPPGAIALHHGGGLLVALRRGFGRFDPRSGVLSPIEVPGLALGDERFNDGRVDRRGRFWVGTLDRRLREPVGRLYRFDPAHVLQAEDHGFVLSNGIAWSPDGGRMYFAETSSRQVYEYRYDAESGRLADRRCFADVGPGHGGPDGLCVDAEGNVWVTLFERSVINMYRPDGRPGACVRLPVRRPTSCTFGGPDMRTLYITSARIGLSDSELQEQAQAGGVWAVEVAQTGQTENVFGAVSRAAVPDVTGGRASCQAA